MLLELIIVGAVVYLVYFYLFDRDPTFPPGPKGLPGIGVVPQQNAFLDVSPLHSNIKAFLACVESWLSCSHLERDTEEANPSSWTHGSESTRAGCWATGHVSGGG